MREAKRTILIAGGYGTFGGRLAQLLADEERLTLVIAGRSIAKAHRFCANLTATAHLVPLSFDRNENLDIQLAQIKPDIVVDATGPFQSYGDDPYRLVKACLRQRINYLDLADGSDFVRGIAQFDHEAKAQNVFVLSGVSSFPVLTAAVLRELSRGLSVVDSVAAGIAPSPYAGVGLNVIRAIAGYAGKPVKLIRDGRQSIGYALTETKRYTIAPPGRLPLNNIRFSLVDVPDLQLIPDMAPGIRSMWVGAGPVPEILHLALSGLAWLVRLGLVPSLSPFARLFYRVINVLRWGEHRGGMFVAVEGADGEGRKVERSWHLLAEADDGPLIPSMASEAVVRHMLAGGAVAPGARPATDALSLADYDVLFARRTIYTGRREIVPRDPSIPLYRELLGDAWADLPEPLRALHEVEGRRTAKGVANIERGTSFLSGVIAAFAGFPRKGWDIPVKVVFDARDGRETWRRTFGDQVFSSVQMAGKGRAERLLCESFGPLTFGIALLVEDGKLRLVVRRWTVFGLPLPVALAPRSDAFEFVEEGVFHFHVEIAHPLVGLIVRYRGWLKPDA